MGVRAASVGLLVLGLTGGVYLGQNREIQQQSVQAQLVQANQDELELLKARQADHAAARAHRVVAEEAAAAKAATEVQSAAGKARTLEKKVLEEKKAEEEEKAKETTSGPVAFTGDIPSSCNEYSGSRKIGCALMLDAGFKLDQFPCLDKLWKKESGWNYKATNRSSGA